MRWFMSAVRRGAVRASWATGYWRAGNPHHTASAVNTTNAARMTTIGRPTRERPSGPASDIALRGVRGADDDQRHVVALQRPAAERFDRREHALDDLRGRP